VKYSNKAVTEMPRIIVANVANLGTQCKHNKNTKRIETFGKFLKVF